MRLFKIAIAALFLFGIVNAQEALTNQSVIKMVKAGLGDDVIATVISSQPARFSLGPDDLITLKSANVSDKVLKAMMAKAQGSGNPLSASAPPAASQQAPVDEIGVYFKKSDVWTALHPEVVNWKTGGVLKSIGTAGIVKGDVNGRLNNAHSPNPVTTPVEVLIYTPEGVDVTEYQLIKLREEKGAREFRTVTGGVMHVSGGATRDLLEFQGTKIGPRLYTITLNLIKGGEYGFLPPGAALSSHGSSSLGKMYTFRVIE